MLLLSLLLCASCSKKKPEDTADAAAPTIIGVWALPESEWLSKSAPEYWEFTADGKFAYYQADTSGKVTNTVDGTYIAEGEKLTVTMAGFPLEYTYKLIDANTMLRSDHGTDVTITRYLGALTK